MAQFVNIFDIDLQQRNDPLPLRSIIGEGDANGLRVGACVFDGGEPVTLGGQCVGKVIRADGTTVPLTGTVADNTAYVVLDQTSCAVEGPVQVAVMWVSGTNVTTLVVAYGTVVNTQTGTIIEPGEPIPDITELLAEIEAMREATAAAELAAEDVNSALEEIVFGNIEKLASIPNTYINTSGAEAENTQMRCSDFIPIPEGATAFEMYVFYGGSSLISPVAVMYNESKTMTRYLGGQGNTNGYKTFEIKPREKYVRFNASMPNSSDNGKYLFRFISPLALPKENTDLLAVAKIAISSTAVIYYGCKLEAGKTYGVAILDAQIPQAQRLRLLPASGTDVYADLTAFKPSALFIPSADDYLRFYPVSGLSNFTATIAIYEYGNQPVITRPRVYYVDKNNTYATYAYTSLTQCLLDLKDDENEKIIYIEGGEYDIWQEYVDAGVPVYSGSDPTSEYFPYCVWVPKNTHIIGRGIVRLKWMPNKNNVTVVQCQAVSPLNVANTCTIENIEVYCKNGRYCLHNDGLGYGQFVGAVQKYINCRFIKYADEEDGSGNQYGKAHTIGFGIDARMRHEYINCEFINEGAGSAFYGHTRAASDGVTTPEIDSPNIIVRDSIIKSVVAQCARLDNASNSITLHVRTKFANTYFSGYIGIRVEPNAYDVTLLYCNNPEIVKAGSDYPVTVYPPTT